MPILFFSTAFLMKQLLALSPFPAFMFFIRFQFAHYFEPFFFSVSYPVKKVFFGSTANFTYIIFHFTKSSAGRRNH